MKDKLNIIFKPYILTLLGLIVIYTLLHWLLIIKFEVFSFKEVITNFIIPFCLAALAAWFFLRPNLKILNLNKKDSYDNYRDFYCCILWFILSIPLILTQEYIQTATGKLTELDSIEEINKHEPTKYYTLKNYYADNQTIGIHTSFEVHGKNNETLGMYIYVVMPIYENSKDMFVGEPLAWLGVKYSETISNRLEIHEKEAKYQIFSDKSQIDFYGKVFSGFTYFERIKNFDDQDEYIEALKDNPAYKSNQTILVGMNEPFESKDGNKLMWVVLSIIIGSVIWLIMIAIPKIDQKQLKRVKAGKPDRKAQKEMKEFVDFLKPQDGFFITPILIYINIGIYLLMVIMGLGFISFGGEDLLAWGANYRPLTENGEYWRLLSSTFLHGGLMHLLANMYGLLFVGIFLEPLLGRMKYLTVYLLTGILASAASIWWYDATVSVGASGAIFGLYGVFLALLLTKIYPPHFAKSFLISTSIFVGVNLLMGLAGGIDNAAHIGGLVSGFILGLTLYPVLKEIK